MDEWQTFGEVLRQLRKGAKPELSLRALAQAIPYDKGTLSRIERGLRRPPPEAVVKLIDNELGAAGQLVRLAAEVASAEAAAKLVDKRPAHDVATLGQRTNAAFGTMDSGEANVLVSAEGATGEVVYVSLPRRNVVVGMGAAAVLAAAPLAAVANANIDHVQHFHQLRLSLMEQDNLFGAAEIVPLMEGAIEKIRRLRRAGFGNPDAMLRMQILYAEGCAWLHQDGRNFEASQYWSDRALEWSHRLGDDYYIALSLIRKAQLANDMGDGDEAVELAHEAARVSPPRSRFAATAATFEGVGHTRSDESLNVRASRSARAFDDARRLLAETDHDPKWGFFLDPSYIEVHQAHARMQLGDHEGASQQFTTAIAGMQPRFPRDKGVYLARNAIAHMNSGHIEQATKLGREALEIGAATGSARILCNVGALDRMIDPDSKQTGVAEFRDDIEKWKV